MSLLGGWRTDDDGVPRGFGGCAGGVYPGPVLCLLRVVVSPRYVSIAFSFIALESTIKFS